MGSSSNGDFVTPQSMASYAAGSFTENGLESFLGGSSAWNPLAQMPPHRQTDSSSNLFDCTRMSAFNNGSCYPSMVGSVDLSECNQFAAGQVSPCSYQEKEEFGDVKTGIQVTDEGGDASRWCKEGEEASSEDESPSMAHGKKRKRTPDGGDLRTSSDCSQGKDEKKPQSPMGKPSGKQPKNQPQNAGASKEDYIHVRAKRGQATNSHSLAERVRREKISERMKLLQDLVPGCNKVIGKAVMLDEIINYVQSLQRQVEFLSMKLAAVNPDLNFDIQRILSKEILNARGSGSAALRYGPGLNASHSQLFVSPHANIQDETLNRSINNSADPLHAANAQFSTIPQMSGVWDDEFQGVMHQIDYAGNCISRQS